MTSRRKRAAQVAAIAGALCAPIAALASGQINVQQSDGSTQTYDNVRMKLVGLTLFLSSPDRKDVLEVVTDACSYPAGVERCLPYATSLRRDGHTHKMQLERGAVFLNVSGDVEHLPHSSQILGPHQVIVHLHTMRGTYISAQGTLDGMK